jgi:hypothetical protein
MVSRQIGRQWLCTRARMNHHIHLGFLDGGASSMAPTLDRSSHPDIASPMALNTESPQQTGFLVKDEGIYVDSSEDRGRNQELIAWIRRKGMTEFGRLRSLGMTCLFFMPKNCGLVVDCETHPNGKPFIINRIELSTGFHFDRIAELKCSPPFSCRPYLNHYDYRHLLLSCTNRPVVVVVPYIYPQTLEWIHPVHGRQYHLKNKLDEWLFINSRFQRSRLRVNEFVQ